MERKGNRYSQIIEDIFSSHFQEGTTDFLFKRDELITHALKRKMIVPKNLGDLLYTYRYRGVFPESIQRKAPKGKVWIIRPAGRAVYRFVAVKETPIFPNPLLKKIEIDDKTPEIVTHHALRDEQGLLARVRYNKLVSLFTGINCHSLQNHLRTNVPDVGQIEVDELYVGEDSKHIPYILPVQAKGGKDRQSIVQIEQDHAFCLHRYPELVCKPIAVQFMSDDSIAMFSFKEHAGVLEIDDEKHYLLIKK